MNTSGRQKCTLRQNLLFSLLFAALLGLLGYQLFGQLGEMYITDYDEARHGVNAYEMIRNDDYLVSTYQEQPDLWNLKPPMSFWLIALSYRIFGYNAFALRFFSALAALFTAAALGIWMKRRYGGWAALFMLVFFIGNPVLLDLHFARFGDADAQYQFFFTLAMLCMLGSGQSFKWLYGSALCFGLAFLEKGTHAFVIPVVCLFYVILTGRIRQLTFRRILLLLATGLLFILPWAIARYTRDGMTFFTSMFATDVSGRIGTTADPRGGELSPLIYYLWTCSQNPMLLICLSLCVISFIVLIVRRIKLPRDTRDAVLGSALWLVVPILLYSLANVKYRWYIYSALMAFPTLTVILMASLIQLGGWKRVLQTVGILATAGLMTLAVMDVVNIAQTTFHHVIQGFIRSNLERDYDSGKHAYIVYNEKQRSQWMQADMLTALMYGDVVCMDGGEEAFLADEDSAVLFVCKESNMEDVQELMEQEPVRNEDYYMVAFDNE